MKRLATLVLAAGLVFSSVTGASAVDFNVKGEWIMSFDLGKGMKGYDSYNYGNYNSGTPRSTYEYGSGKGTDVFNAEQRVRLQIDAVASEALSGTVFFEMGDTTWGNIDDGGALGADKMIIELKRAHIDWIIPQTDVKVRMGIQPIALPAFSTGGSMILDEEVAGITISNQFNENVGMTFLWARPYNDNYDSDNFYALNDGYVEPSSAFDNIDIFGLLVPMTFDGAKITPWLMYTSIGSNAINNGLGVNADIRNNGSNVITNRVTDYKNLTGGMGSNGNGIYGGLLPAYFNAGHRNDVYLDDYASAFHVGITGEVTAGDPFRIAWDLNYGSADFSQDYLNRSGFYGSLLAEYKLDWGTPGLYFWYSTGDDGDAENGSERMATIQPNSTNNFSNLAGTGASGIAREAVLGYSLVGTWGIGARIKDFSFMEDLKQTFRLNYIGGTNSPYMAKQMRGAAYYQNADQAGINGVKQFTDGAPAFSAGDGMYLTTEDSAFEIGLTSEYQIYENLEFILDASYLVLNLDQSESVWGGSFAKTDAFNLNATFIYSF